MNTLIAIGNVGRYRCYLNIDKQDAIDRYSQREAIFPADFAAMLTDGYIQVKELDIDVEFRAIDVFEK